MDSRGYWHEQKNLPDLNELMAGGGRERPVITAEIGQRVTVAKDDGQCFSAVFMAVERNRVTVRPEPETWPYLEFAEGVSLVIDGKAVRAQVWDNRGGLVILRTLPL